MNRFTLLSIDAVRAALSGAGAPLTVIDARDEGAYAQGHLPGAHWLGWEDWCQPAPAHGGVLLQQPGYWGVLDDRRPEWLADRLAAAGLHAERPIVVYDEGPRSWGRAGRIAWMLLYLGAQQVALLDGTWNDWLASGGPVSRARPPAGGGHFPVIVQPLRRARHADLVAAYRAGQRPVLLDTRRPEDWT